MNASLPEVFRHPFAYAALRGLARSGLPARRTAAEEAKLAELAALADGSLPAERRTALEARVAESADVAARLEEQERALALVRAAGAAVETPPALRARVEKERRARRRVSRPRPLALGVGLAAAAAAALVLVLTLPPGAGGPTLAEAATVAARPPTGPAPAPQARDPKLLAHAVEGVAFPNYLKKFGWRAVGVRVDELEGRRMTTVF